MVWCAWHHQPPLPCLVVLTDPVGADPLVHKHLLAVLVRSAPPGNHLRDIMKRHIRRSNFAYLISDKIDIMYCLHLPACIDRRSGGSSSPLFCRSCCQAPYGSSQRRPRHATRSGGPLSALHRLSLPAPAPPPLVPTRLCRNPAYRYNVSRNFFQNVQLK